MKCSICDRDKFVLYALGGGRFACTECYDNKKEKEKAKEGLRDGKD